MLRSFKRGVKRRFAFFKIAKDVLDHHNGVIDHEAGSNGQRHQRQIVETKSEQIHHSQCANEREWHRHAWNDGGAQVSQEQKDRHHHKCDREHERELHVTNRTADCHGAVGQNRNVKAGRQVGLQLWQQLLDAVNHLNGVRARLPLNVYNDSRGLVHPRRQLRVLNIVDHSRDIGQNHGCAIVVGNN